MISGRSAKARAIATRCFCPPESCAGFALDLVRHADHFEQLKGFALSGSARHIARQHGCERDVVQHRFVREQVEELEHHADFERMRRR